MTFHRALLVLRRGPLAGHTRRAVSVSNAVSSLAPSTPQGMSMRSMTTMVHWPGDDEVSLSPARAKLQHVLEEYRQNKYVSSCSYTIPQYSHALEHMPQALPPSVCLFSPLTSPSLLFFVLSFTTIHLQFQSDALFSLSQGNDSRHGREPRRLYQPFRTF
jgi:hypothetical protein